MSSDQTAEPRTWQQRLAERWWKLKEADHALQIDKDAQRQNSVARLVTLTQNRAFGLTSEAAPPEPEDVGVSIDSPTTYNTTHHHPAPPGMGTAAKLAAVGLGAAGVGTGVGLPLAIALPAILEAMKADPPAADAPPPAAVDTDTDTVFDLRLGPPEEDE